MMNELQRKITIWASALEREFRHAQKCNSRWVEAREDHQRWMNLQKHQDLRLRRAAEIRSLASEAPTNASAILFRAATLLESSSDNASPMLTEAAALIEATPELTDDEKLRDFWREDEQRGWLTAKELGKVLDCSATKIKNLPTFRAMIIWRKQEKEGQRTLARNRRSE